MSNVGPPNSTPPGAPPPPPPPPGPAPMPYLGYSPPPAASSGGAVNGLGIASLVVGCFAIAGAWIPFCGMLTIPVAVIGVILGVIALIIASSDRRVRKGMPIAGTSVSGAAIIVAVVVTRLVTHAAHVAGQKIQQNVNTMNQQMQQQAQQAQQQMLKAQQDAQQQAQQSATAPSDSDITLDQFHQLSKDESYDDVVANLGKPATESAFRPAMKVCTWRTRDGGMVTCRFKDDKLSSFQQSNLK